jgi:hypothetical protein
VDLGCRIVARLTDRFLWLGRIDPGPCSDKPSQPLPAELAHLYDVLREPSSRASDWYLRYAAAALDGCSGCKLATQEMQPVTQEQPRHLRGARVKNIVRALGLKSSHLHKSEVSIQRKE